MAHANLNDTITSLQPFFSFPQIKWKRIFCTLGGGSFRGFLTKEKRRRQGILVFLWLLSNDTVVTLLCLLYEGHIIPVFSFMPRLMASSTLALLCCTPEIEAKICTKLQNCKVHSSISNQVLFQFHNIVYILVNVVKENLQKWHKNPDRMDRIYDDGGENDPKLLQTDASSCVC